MNRRWRIAAGSSAATLAVLVLALAWAEHAGWPFLREPLQNAASRAAGTAVRMDGAFSVHFFGQPRLEVEHLQIAPAHGLSVPHLLDTQQVLLEWNWHDIWRWRRGDTLRLQRLRADTFDARLLRLEDGRASWQLGKPRQQQEAAAETPTRPLQGVPRFTLLEVREGRITVDDQPLQTQLQADLKGAEGPALVDGTPPGYEARVTGRWRALPLRLQIRTGATLGQVQDAQADGSPDGSSSQLPLRVEGQAGAAQVMFEGRTAMPGDAARFSGRIRISGPSLAQVGEPLRVTLPQTPPFDLRGTLSRQGTQWQLRAERAAIGRSLLNGDFRFDTATNPPSLRGQLGGERLLLADLAPAVGKSPGGQPERDAPRKVLPQRRFDLPSLNAMDADLQVAIGELDFGSDAISPLRELRTHLQLDDGVLQLNNLQAAVAGGRFGGNTTLDASVQPARWLADLNFRTVDIAGWLPALRTPAGRAQAPARNAATLKQRRDTARQGGDQTVQAYLTGTMSGVVQVTGRGRSTAEILSTLDGSAQLTLRDGTLSHLATEAAGLDVAQALAVLIRRDHPLPLRCARLDLLLNQGVVRPRLAVLDNSDSTIRIDGQVNLSDETLALRATTLPKDFSPLSLRAPVIVGGTLGAPKVGIEGQRLAGKVLGSLVLGGAVGPWAALLPLVDPGQRAKGDPCATPAAAAPAVAAASAPPAKAR